VTVASGPALRVAGAALTTLAAGFVLGLAVGRSTAPRGLGLEPGLSAWNAATAAALGLDDRQREELRILLHHYARERDALLAEQLETADEPWRELDRRFETLFLQRILREDQRRRAQELLTRGGPAVAPTLRGG